MQETHRQRDRVAAGVRESPTVPTCKDVLECSLDRLVEAEPTCETLRDLAHRRERRTGPRAGVGDRLLDEGCANLGGTTGADVFPVEREHLLRVGGVDEIEGSPVRDVVAVEQRRLVPVRRAPGSVQERDVVRVRKLLGRSSRELAEPNRENGGSQRVLERLPGAEVGGE